MATKCHYNDTADLVADFLAGGGKITKCKAKAARDAGGREFAHTKQTLKDKRSKRR